MKSLREFAQFVGKPAPFISLRALTAYLSYDIHPDFISMREITGLFDDYTVPIRLEEISVGPTDGIVPFEIGMQITRTKGFPLAHRWRILQGGQQVAVYEKPVQQSGQFAHTFTEAGSYTVEATLRGIGSTGYGEPSKAVTVMAKPKPAPSPPPPSPSRPDLAFTGPATWNRKTRRIEIGFRNNGNANAGAFRVGAQVNNFSIGEVIYEGMSAGRGDTVSFDPGFLSPGDYSYNFVLDLYSAVGESNEENNNFNGYFTV